MKEFYKGLMSAVLLSFTGLAFAYQNTTKDFQQFRTLMMQKHGYTQEAFDALFHDVEVREDILQKIQKPAEHMPWFRYQKIFLTEPRIQAGKAFLQQHAKALKQAEQTYGIPAEIITAIIGVETFYGEKQGQYRVLDALTTLAFHYPPRAKFFRSELEHYLIIGKEEAWDLKSKQGSYAGAMGLGQFMPSSYRNFAIDFNGDGARDLFANTQDAIGSVANYFAEHGWRKGELVVASARVQGKRYQALLDKELKPHYTIGVLRKHGVHTQEKITDDTLGKLLALEQEDRDEYWVALHNFYVITRYNHSPLYAMAVYQLSQRLRDTSE